MANSNKDIGALGYRELPVSCPSVHACGASASATRVCVTPVSLSYEGAKSGAMPASPNSHLRNRLTLSTLRSLAR